MGSLRRPGFKIRRITGRTRQRRWAAASSHVDPEKEGFGFIDGELLPNGLEFPTADDYGAPRRLVAAIARPAWVYRCYCSLCCSWFIAIAVTSNGGFFASTSGSVGATRVVLDMPRHVARVCDAAAPRWPDTRLEPLVRQSNAVFDSHRSSFS